MITPFDYLKASATALILTAFFIIALMLGSGSADYTIPPTDVGNLLGNSIDDSGTVSNPVTTVWQTITGQLITGVQQIPLLTAYKRAHEYGITTLGFPYARLERPVLRYEFAIMMINYIENVENKTISHNPLCIISNYKDYHTMSISVKDNVQTICDVGLMGWSSQKGINKNITTLLPIFRPFDVLSTAEMNIVAERYVPTTIRLFPTSNTRGDVIRFLYSISPSP